MGRPEKDLDSAGALGKLAQHLRLLRQQSSLTYREMAARTQLRASTLSRRRRTAPRCHDGRPSRPIPGPARQTRTHPVASGRKPLPRLVKAAPSCAGTRGTRAIPRTSLRSTA